MKKKIRLIPVAILLIAAIAAVLLLRPDKPAATTQAVQEAPQPIVTVFAPDCIRAGYTQTEDPVTGVITMENQVPALGHTYGDWTANPDGSALRTCARCGETQTRLPADASSLPRLDFYGSMEGMSKDQRVTLNASYRDEANSFSCYSHTSWQGHSTLNNDKKNYTVRFFDDEALTSKHRLILREGWQPEHKYVLKANYADSTHCRNLICADVWSRMAAIRPNVHPRLARTSNYGAVDGFVVSLWHNDAFAGLYTLNLHKDDDLYQMYPGNWDAVVICNAQTMDESLFRARAAFEENASDWEVEFSSPDQLQWAQNWFNEMIAFVMETDDAVFREKLHNYVDVDAAIDYLLFMYAMGLSDSAAKDLVMLCYEGGPWTPSAYDMEDAFGLSADGSAALEATAFLPVKTDGGWQSGTGSLLWDRLLNNFHDEIAARWQVLRQEVLDEDALCDQVSQFIHAIPQELTRQDLTLYPQRQLLADPGQQILTYIRQRLPLLDALFVQP